MDVLQKCPKDSKSFNWIIFGSQTYNNNLNRLFFILWWINVLVFIILSSCSFSSVDTSSGSLMLPVRLTGRIRCYFITANRHRRNLICLFINTQADKCKLNWWTDCCPEDPLSGMKWMRVTRNMSICNTICIYLKANSHMKKRSCVLPDIQQGYLFGRNSESSLCTSMFLMAVLQANHTVAAMLQFVNSDQK